ncbi:hypothetical protein SBA2_360026 [Acidobacteriia bacterium SbA2]|nr:hypothetical protein SBA2_360026 [Acidobacteriia bacterium SbA2]
MVESFARTWPARPIGSRVHSSPPPTVETTTRAQLLSVFEIDAITRADFPGCKHGGVNSGAFIVLLNDALQDLGSGFTGGGVERDDDAALVDLDDGDARLVAQAQNTAHPLQLIEGRTTLEIYKQVGPKPPWVRLGLGFLGNAFDSLLADEGDASGVE